MRYDSGMRVQKPENVKHKHERTHEQTHNAGKKNSPTPALQARKGTISVVKSYITKWPPIVSDKIQGLLQTQFLNQHCMANLMYYEQNK